MSDVSFDSPVQQDLFERRPIPDYEGIYEIDRLGNIYALKAHKGLKAGRINKPSKHKKTGYMYINLSKNKKATKHYVHCLVMAAWNPTDDKTLEINHENGDKEDNSLRNLTWMSHAENIRHGHDVLNSWKNHRGESMGMSKLTEDDVKQIRRLWEDGIQQKDIAPMFGVSRVRINMIINRKAWAHVE